MFAVEAAIVVGADGARSTVADRVTAPIERAGTGATGVVYGYWSGLDADGYEWIYRPSAAAGIIPTNDDQTCVSRRPARPASAPAGSTFFARSSPRPRPTSPPESTPPTAPSGVRSFKGRPGFIRRSWGSGWALVGDAGYWKDPISVHGLTDALRDAELLADRDRLH